MTFIPLNPNGPASPGASSPVAMSGQSIIGTAKLLPALNYEFLTDSTNGWFDALGFTWVSFSIAALNTSGGVVQLECTNDINNAPNGIPLNVQDENSVFGTVSRITSVSIASTTYKQMSGPITARYIRVRVSTAVTGGGATTVKVTAFLRHAAPQTNSYVAGISSPLPTNTNTTIGNVILGAGSAVIGAAAFNHDAVINDSNATVYSTNTTSSVYQLANLPTAASFGLRVTAATGAGPTLDVKIQESHNGTTFTDLYHFERITTTGALMSPIIRINGSSLRYIFTVGGTIPSFTVTSYRQHKPIPGLNLRAYFDRDLIAAQALNSTTAAYNVQSTNEIQMIIPSGAATTASVFQLQGSDDNSTWYGITSLTTLSDTTVATSLVAHSSKWIRAYCTTAGVGQTLSYIGFSAVGP